MTAPEPTTQIIRSITLEDRMILGNEIGVNLEAVLQRYQNMRVLLASIALSNRGEVTVPFSTARLLTPKMTLQIGQETRETPDPTNVSSVRHEDILFARIASKILRPDGEEARS